MTISLATYFASKNRILATLPREEYERLLPHLEPVHLDKGKIIYHPGDRIRDVFFPQNGMISLLSITSRGEIVEVGMVGNEGLVGVSIILKGDFAPYQSVVQLDADVFKIKAEVMLKEFNRGEKLQDLLLRYTHGVLTQITQSALCNRFHTLEERFCRWLLVTSDRVNSNTIELTQEMISQMLGTRRTGVTKAAGAFQDKGFIRYRRGKIVIFNRQGLERCACECYEIVRKEVSSSLAS